MVSLQWQCQVPVGSYRAEFLANVLRLGGYNNEAKVLRLEPEVICMGAPKYLEKREHDRHEASGEPFPGKIVVLSSGDSITARLMDVSARGLGLLVRVPLKHGERLHIEISSRSFTLEVVYSEPYLGIDNLHRIGLFARDQDVDLDAALKVVAQKK